MPLKGKPLTEEHKRKIGLANKGKKHSEETKEKIRQHNLKNPRRYWTGKKRPYKSRPSMKGKEPWNKGLTKNNDKRVKKYANKLKGKKGLFGKDNPSWKGGVTPINHLLRKSDEYKEWRNAVYQRDNWTCRICGIKCSNKQIVAHHILLFSEYPHLRFAIDNGMTLCRKCHLKLHKNL